MEVVTTGSSGGWVVDVVEVSVLLEHEESRRRNATPMPVCRAGALRMVCLDCRI
jgi:hypothetical protein